MLTECGQKHREEVKKDQDIKAAEIKLCGSFAEHNFSFRSANHLPGVLKSAFHDLEIAKSMTLGRRKLTGLIKNVIVKSHTEDLTTTLKKSKLSAIIDESTDIGASKNLTVCLRFFITS